MKMYFVLSEIFKSAFKLILFSLVVLIADIAGIDTSFLATMGGIAIASELVLNIVNKLEL
jgi:hypothetical protein